MNPVESTEQQKQDDISSLIEDFRSIDIKKHQSAHLCLLTLGEDAIPALVKALSSSDRSVRWEAAKTLVDMRNPALAPVLTKELEGDDADVRWLAAEGLLAVGREGLAPLLKALIERPTSTWLLQGAHHILKDLYLGRRHEGENRYTSIYLLGEDLRQKIRPVLSALESSKPSLKLPFVATEALNYLQTQK